MSMSQLLIAAGEAGTAMPLVIPNSEIDALLTAQFAVAWAGEGGETPRLGWWKSDMVSEFGGRDLLKSLLPLTSEWGALQAVREVARRRDADYRQQDHDPDRIVSLYRLGYEIDERAEERLAELKRLASRPSEALPGLQHVIHEQWQREAFGDWVKGHGSVRFENDPIGRRVPGAPPESLSNLVSKLVAVCWPLSDTFPMPHFRSAS